MAGIAQQTNGKKVKGWSRKRAPTRQGVNAEDHTRERFGRAAGAGTFPADSGPVLLVEDNDMVRELTQVMLEQLGYEVVSARDGCEALDRFKAGKDRFGVVLSDVVMPGMDGWQTMAAIKALRPDIPVILTSGYSEPRAFERNRSLQPEAFLNKPFKMQVLQEILERVLDRDSGWVPGVQAP
jgi:CheY-like chemotaxis protein